MPGIASIATIPTPVGGWNVMSSLDNMPPADAVILDNMFPETSAVRLRRGYNEHIDTGETDPVKTLMEYAGGDNIQLLACVAGKVFDVSDGAIAAVELATGYSTDIWSFTNYSTAGGQYLLAANLTGMDVPWVYDGTTVSPVVVSGVTATDLIYVSIYQQRVFYVEKDTLSVWYTAAGAFQGALTQFDFGPFCTRGGEIAAITTWTRDNGFGGVDDLFVVATTKGEVLIYNGPNPSVDTTWAMQGRFIVGEPVKGPHCLVRTGPDVIFLCSDGFQPLSSYLQMGQTRAQETDIASKIGNAASDAVKLYDTLDGWQGFLYPEGTALMINIPTDTDAFMQYVVNTTTGAWCRYLGLTSYTWCRFNGEPYFGGDAGKVYLWDTTPSDNGSDIVGEVLTAFNFLGSRAAQKRVTMTRPVVTVNGTLSYVLGVNVDFDTTSSLVAASSNIPVSGTWGFATWDSDRWGAAAGMVQRRWIGVHGTGYAVAVHLKVSTHTVSMYCNSFDVAFEPGGPI